ncbi:vegetative cell wall protein gp1-like isoform X7 [Panicum virgatum]|uniref:vegetative cell wall protein gp1-like isoform X7 n=1 Tax=Panicum virgatum TaxID=38727 RepID=UPI0019D62E21|nr:vegetative cell wall protein gp1-like isoform X7 [Panicum virgatum]
MREELPLPAPASPSLERFHLPLARSSHDSTVPHRAPLLLGVPASPRRRPRPPRLARRRRRAAIPLSRRPRLPFSLAGAAAAPCPLGLPVAPPPPRPSPSVSRRRPREARCEKTVVPFSLGPSPSHSPALPPRPSRSPGKEDLRAGGAALSLPVALPVAPPPPRPSPRSPGADLRRTRRPRRATVLPARIHHARGARSSSLKPGCLPSRPPRPRLARVPAHVKIDQQLGRQHLGGHHICAQRSRVQKSEFVQWPVALLFTSAPDLIAVFKWEKSVFLKAIICCSYKKAWWSTLMQETLWVGDGLNNLADDVLKSTTTPAQRCGEPDTAAIGRGDNIKEHACNMRRRRTQERRSKWTAGGDPVGISLTYPSTA